MRARNVWIIAGIAVLALLGWYVLRGKETPSATPDRRSGASSGTGVASGAGSTTPTREPTRSIPPPRVTPKAPDPSDEGWADRTRQTLQTRLDQVLDGSGVTVLAIECATPVCKIVVEAADDAALSAAISRFESPEGLYGFAQQIILGAPEDAPGGRRREQIDAEF
jgi:hypothetical protein